MSFKTNIADFLTERRPDIDSPESRAVFVVARKEGYKTLRRILKKQIKNEFDLDMYDYDTYESRMSIVHNIGNRFLTPQCSATDFDIKAAKGEIFRKEYKNGEGPLDLVEWGPFCISDQGSVRCTFESLKALVKGKSSIRARIVGDDTNKRKDYEIMKDEWDFHGRMNFRISPWESIRKRNMNNCECSVALCITLDRIYGHRDRTLYSFEYEVKYCTDGEIINFLSIEIPLR